MRAFGLAIVRLGLPVLAAWLGFTALHASGAFAEQSKKGNPENASQVRPAMTFTTGVNALGLLNSVAVSPAQVHIPAGQAVDFVNSSAVPLSVNVGQQILQIPSHEARAFQFSGTQQEQNLPVRATAVDLPVVGDLVSTPGSVVVAAIPAASVPPTSSAIPPAGHRSGSSHPGSLPAVPNSTNKPAVPATSDAPNTGVGDGGAAVPIPASEAAQKASENPSTLDNAANEQALDSEDLQPTAYRAWGAISSGMGLLIVVATILLIGVAAAAMRAVVGYRLPTRTASQAS